MQDYRGIERQIRVTNRGRYQVLPVPHDSRDLSTEPVFDTREAAEAYIRRPMPKWELAERDRQVERQGYQVAYAAILADPSLREMRRAIQSQYAEAAHRSKLAADHQRAAVRAEGRISPAGRDISAARQTYADEIADESDEQWARHRQLCAEYERELQTQMTATGIPIGLFREPIVVQNAVPSLTRPWFERFPECRQPFDSFVDVGD